MGRLNIKPGEIIVYAKKNGVQNDISQKCNVGNAKNEMYTQNDIIIIKKQQDKKGEAK